MEIQRVLPAEPLNSIEAYLATGGGKGIAAARAVLPDVIIAEVEASGLRGRGGAGFPTGIKWRTVAESSSDVLATTVVVNAAEGEPGTYKDRTLLHRNPYAVIEGALIAAQALGAHQVVIALKESFEAERARVAAASVEMARWTEGVSVDVTTGPNRYLFGEETALLEVLAGRLPLPRVAPPYRRGVIDVVDEPADGATANVVMAGEGADRVAPPTLVNNAETLANVPAILAGGAAWFRSVGTGESPGTILVTATGDVARPGVFEVAMGTPLHEIVELAGGPTSPLQGVLGGVSSPFLTDLTTPLSYEAMAAAGSGLGSASLRFVGEATDLVGFAAGVSHFLAVESCGQCTACKIDGTEIARRLDNVCGDDGEPDDLDVIAARLATVADGARCNIGRQHQDVVGSILAAAPDRLAELATAGQVTAPVAVGPLTTIADGQASVDTDLGDPGWSGLDAAAEA